jgi:hypothetical protein
LLSVLWGLWVTAAVIDVQGGRLRDTKQWECVDFPNGSWPIDLPAFRDRPVAAHVLRRWPH